MLKEFLNRIMELKQDEMIEDKRGIQHILNSNGGYDEVSADLPWIKEPLIPDFRTNSLTSIVDYIKQNFDNNKNGFVIQVMDHETVCLKTEVFGDALQRQTLISAGALNPEFRFGNFYDQENFIISLMTKFVETEGSKYALGVAAGIVEGEEAKLVDDGMSQRVVMKKGITTVAESEVTPYINLQPFRTFREIEQPKSMFLLRLREGAKLAVFEADGGAWKNEAIQNIVDYFEANLEKEEYSILY